MTTKEKMTANIHIQIYSFTGHTWCGRAELAPSGCSDSTATIATAVFLWNAGIPQRARQEIVSQYSLFEWRATPGSMSLKGCGSWAVQGIPPASAPRGSGGEAALARGLSERAAVRADSSPPELPPLLPNCPQQTLPRSESPPSPKSEASEQSATTKDLLPGWSRPGWGRPARLSSRGEPRSRPHLPGPAAAPASRGPGKTLSPRHAQGSLRPGQGPENPYLHLGGLPDSPGSRAAAARAAPPSGALASSRRLRAWVSPGRWGGSGAGQGQPPSPRAPAQVSGAG